jgi:general secretion pathway protein I
MTHHHRQRLHPTRITGFTLIEVMVALAIVAVALAAGTRAAGSLTDNAERLALVTSAHWCADNELTGMRLAHALPGIGESEFSCEELGRNFRGKLVTRPTDNANMRRVDAVISDEQGRHLLTLTTVLARF